MIENFSLPPRKDRFYGTPQAHCNTITFFSSPPPPPFLSSPFPRKVFPSSPTLPALCLRVSLGRFHPKFFFPTSDYGILSVFFFGCCSPPPIPLFFSFRKELFPLLCFGWIWFFVNCFRRKKPTPPPLGLSPFLFPTCWPRDLLSFSPSHVLKGCVCFFLSPPPSCDPSPMERPK